ncbi:MAG: flagellar hook-associated protein FlgL [Dehalococcoidia bacterium]
MRISDRMLTHSVMANLNGNIDRLLKVERELSSGRRINAPSDDPAGAATAIRLRTEAGATEQHGRTVEAATSRLSAADSALGGITDLLQRARELTVQSGGASIGPDEMRAIATEINQLLHHAIQTGNTNFGGQYLFAGTKTTTPAFTTIGNPPATVTYAGNANPINLDIGRDAPVQVDVPGDQAILPGINALIQIRDALNGGDRTAATQAGLPAIDAALDGLLQVRSGIGARINRLEALGARMQDERLNLETRRSELEDVDIADVTVRLNSTRNVYQAALGAAAQAIQPSLLSFLR